MLSNRAILVLCLLATVVLLTPRTAAACSCLPPPPPGEAASQSDAVFAGEVTSTQIEATAPGFEVVRVSFSVLESYKGAEQEIELYTPTNSAACGFNFEEGEQYLVYANQAEGRLNTGLCTRTRALAEAGEDLKALGMSLSAADKRSCGGPTNTGMLQAAFLLLMGVALTGHRVRR